MSALIGLQLQRLWAPRRLREPRRGLRAYQFALALACLFLLHALAVNALLWSGALGWLLARSTGVVHVDAGRSFSVWPGVVQLRGLRLEVTDGHVHLQLEVPEGRANISLRELLRRRFVAASVSGQHFVLRLRPHFKDLSEVRRAALPPLAEPVSNPPSGKQPYLWPVSIQGLAAQFDELWVSELRYRGDARVQGGFELVPDERVSVAASDVELRAGALTYGPDQPLLELRQAQLHAQLQETAIERLQQEWPRNLSARVDLDARVRELAFLASLLPELAGVSDGQGDLRLRGAVEHGEWVDGVELEYAAPHIAYVNGAWQGSLGLQLEAHAAAEAAGASGQVALPVTLRLQAGALDLHDQHILRLEQAGLKLQLARTLPWAWPRAFELELRGLALDGLQALPRGLRPGHWQPRSLSVPRAQAALAWSDGTASGSAEAAFRDLNATYRGWSVSQSGTLALQGVRWKGLGFKLHAAGLTLDLDAVNLRQGETRIDDWKLRLELSDLAYAPVARSLSAGFLAVGADARPVLSLLGVHGLAPRSSDFLAMPELKVRGRIAVSPQQQDISVERAQSETIDVQGRWLREGEETRAALRFVAAPLSLGVEVEPSDTSVRLFASEAWLRERLERLGPAAAPEDGG